MGSYITGIIIAMAMVFGLYAALETAAGKSLFAQDKYDSTDPVKLRKIASADVDLRGEDIKGQLDNRVEAILQLGGRPGDLKETVPLLARLANHQDIPVKNAAHASLNLIGQPAAPFMKSFFDRDTLDDYRAACSGIRAIGEPCKIYLPQIKKLLQSDVKIERRCGLYALQGLGKSGIDVLDEIIVCLDDEDFNNQCSACRILESYGADAAPANEALLKLLETGNPSTRGWAAVCLGGIGAKNAKDVDIAKVLASKLDARNPIEQQRVLTGLALLGPDAIGVLDAVKKKAEHRDGFVRSHAGYAIWRISKDDDVPFKLFEEMLANDQLAPDALDLIGRMGNAGLPMLDRVVKKLSSTEAPVREEALIAIGRMGNGAARAKSQIEELLKDDDALVRVAARRTLEKIASKE